MSKWIIALICVAGSLAAQDGTFRSDTRLVLMDVIVSNKGVPVRGLTQDDFQIEDKGKAQKIAVFEMVDAGQPAAPPQPLPPMVVSNRLNSKGETRRTATVVLYDRINTSAADQALVGQQVLKLLASLGENDSVGFYSLGFRLETVSDFREPAGKLAGVAKQFQQKAAAEALEDQPMYKALEAALTPMQQQSNQARVNITTQAFRALGRHLAGVPGSKHLLWVTSSFPLTFGNSVEQRQTDEREFQAFANLLTESNISLYPVDPGGAGASLSTPFQQSTEGQLLEREGATLIRTNQANSLTGIQGLLNLAEKTGGKVYRSANNIEPALRDVIGLSGVSYTLGFYPDQKSLDGRTHKLEVKLVKSGRTQGADLAHRKEYLAWAGKDRQKLTPVPQVGELMADPVDSTAVELMAAANPDAAKPGFHQLDVRVSVGDLQMQKRGDKVVGAFDLALGIEGAQGGSVETFNLEWTEEQYRKGLQGGLVVGKSLETTGDSGRFHVVVLDKSSGAAGSVLLPFASK